MKFRKIKRWITTVFDTSHNRIYVNLNSVYSAKKSATIMDAEVRMNGKSKLIIEDGAKITNARFQIDNNSEVHVDKDAELKDVDICVWNNSSVYIGQRTIVSGVNFSIEKGQLNVGNDNVISQGGRMDKTNLIISNGTAEIEDHNALKNTFWVRFGGKMVIGRYNCINEGSEIRCDESVTIGSYNMISYNCDIWDTNTHSHYTLDKKQKMFEKDFPRIGAERIRPKTKPIVIGNGNWIGKYACVLKGTVIGNDVTIGTRAVVSNKEICDGKTIVSPKCLEI